jgi:hypothetical protein
MDASILISSVIQVVDLIRDLYQQQKAGNVGAKPAIALVRQYEQAVYTIRDQPLPSGVKGVTHLLVESIDAFESGRVLDAGRSVMVALEQFEGNAADHQIAISPAQSAAIGQFRARLFKMVVPAPELKQQRIDL